MVVGTEGREEEEEVASYLFNVNGRSDDGLRGGRCRMTKPSKAEAGRGRRRGGGHSPLGRTDGLAKSEKGPKMGRKKRSKTSTNLTGQLGMMCTPPPPPPPLSCYGSAHFGTREIS
jgi:hypothetical protein